MKKIIKLVAIVMIVLVIIGIISAVFTSGGRDSFQKGFDDARQTQE